VHKITLKQTNFDRLKRRKKEQAYYPYKSEGNGEQIIMKRSEGSRVYKEG
jgi:hypothetical protein